MKQYQDPDILHGHGKAMPHPKRPTQCTYRSGYRNISVNPFALRTAPAKKPKATAAVPGARLSICAAILALIGPLHARSGKR